VADVDQDGVRREPGQDCPADLALLWAVRLPAPSCPICAGERSSRHDRRAGGAPRVAPVLCEWVNAPEHIARVRRLEPDVIASVAPEIFRGNILSPPRLGCINIHYGRLRCTRYDADLLTATSRREARGHHGARNGRGLRRRNRAWHARCWLHRRDNLPLLKRAGARLMIDVLRRMRADPIRDRSAWQEQAAVFRLSKAGGRARSARGDTAGWDEVLGEADARCDRRRTKADGVRRLIHRCRGLVPRP
jgi:hypothetical protein